MQDISKWKVYEMKNHPGLVIVRNPFTPMGQRFWISKSLAEYPVSPNRNNLLPTKYPDAVISQWWNELQAANKLDPNFNSKLKQAMRWTTLGFHYDWDTKKYCDEARDEFPFDLERMSWYVSKVLGCQKFSPEAAIINYYPIGSMLSGHIDHSEVALDSPLFSFSFGQSAIFLIGGKSKDDKPSAIRLRSGDICMMSGESRLCYHAVPKVMRTEEREWDLNFNQQVDPKNPKTTQKYSEQNLLNDLYWAQFEDYVTDSRININIRQVLTEGQTCISPDDTTVN